MTHTYNISGMTCGNCVAKAKSKLLVLGDVISAEVQLPAPQATITMARHIPLPVLQQALDKAGNYTITESVTSVDPVVSDEQTAGWFQTYKPILLIGAFLTGVTLLIEIGNSTFDPANWMRNFMAGFFLIFSFFKLLNLEGFAQTYSTYDLLAKVWPGWAYLYPFIELGLGIAFLVGFSPLATNTAALILMSVSIMGVLKAVLNRSNIQCACLGDVFKLPMSTITLVEDGLMILMSGAMIMALI